MTMSAELRSFGTVEISISCAKTENLPDGLTCVSLDVGTVDGTPINLSLLGDHGMQAVRDAPGERLLKFLVVANALPAQLGFRVNPALIGVSLPGTVGPTRLSWRPNAG